MQPVSQPVNPGSSSQKPDLDWSQAKETITMLCLATAQIEAALRDSTNSVDALAQSFTKIANDSQQVLKIASLMEVEESNRAHHSELTKSATELHVEIKNSIISFQFQDRVSQKLAHVNRSLGLVADLISDSDRLFQPNQWRNIQDEISKSYTLECEKIMFEKILDGATIKEALRLYEQSDLNNAQITGTGNNEDDIELF
ncbi:MAG: hypothetical protein JKY01_05320 [Pseudomonadales bacterium]|nr:hypothetical protein [Pseudomonadales bacterium]